MTRLMCSSDRTEVEWVKQQLFRAGIRSQIRGNPVAQALRVTRLELWVEDDRDFLTASKVYAALGPGTAQEAGSAVGASKQPILDVEQVATGLTQAGPRAHERRDPNSGALHEATRLLGKEIEDLLAREAELAKKCGLLQTKVEELSQTLAKCQDELVCQTATRAAAEKVAAELTESRRALEAEVSQLRLRLRARENAILTAEAKTEALEQQLRSYAGNLGILYGRVHGKNAAGPGVRPRKQP